ncbi:protein FAM161A-like [Sitophilus oryzae]|uniref:Protein FAM161A-like n=1 Tax=Sitophilus oryzae TaxID=7048 RepID=A0A6J2YMR3_SITOR|nr:protein FAM161A-like [Sitophilus oryzae]
MFDHQSSVYNNNCIKVPRNSITERSQTLYDQKFLNQLHNEVTKNLNEKMKSNIIDSKNDSSLFIDFYDSIPEYHEINHLSNQEFYRKLEHLKDKHREFCDYMHNQLKLEIKDTPQWIEDYKNIKVSENNTKTSTIRKKSSMKPFCSIPVPKKSYLDDEYHLSLSDKEGIVKPPSRRSVRIETPSIKSSVDVTPEPYFRAKSRMKNPDDGDEKIGNAAEWDDITTEDFNLPSQENTPLPTEVKSAPNSPLRRRKSVEETEYDGITIPKPFQMTVRDEENKIVEELFLKINKPKEEKLQQFKAHEVPIESQIPLFDKIMENREKRSHLIKEKRKAALQAQMKPFSFTRRDEEIQELSRRFSKSLPCVYNDEMPLKIKKFKAKPIPRNLFSNYIYKKMHEDEFYRALQKKVRAEEMLKHASLPPSMAKREKSKPKIDVCPRSYRDLELENNTTMRKTKKIPNYKAYHDKYERELEELKNEFITTSPRPFKLKTKSRKGKKSSYRISSAVSKSSSDTRTPSSLDMSSINRSNLAAVLRIQSARRRLEMEMMKKLEEAKIKDEARWREKVMRKKPVWQSLAYSHEEDLAMRLQLRRDEDKLRNEEHKLRMQQMLGRVNQQPTLFERQSQIKFPKTRDELLEQLHMEYYALGEKTGNKNRLSELSLTEMKDEAIQAIIDNSDEEFRMQARRNSKESNTSSEDKNA